MKTAEETLSTIEGNSIWGELFKNRGDVYYEDDLIKLIPEAQKEAATEFFKWHWRNYSSHPNPEEILERYDEFIKEVQ